MKIPTDQGGSFSFCRRLLMERGADIVERLSRFTSARICMRERRAEPFLGLVVLGVFLFLFSGLSTDFLAALVCSLVSCLMKESSSSDCFA